MTNSNSATTQNSINTGFKISSTKDNGAIWAIAQTQRSDVSALEVVTDSLNRGKSTLDVAISAAESISDLLNLMRAKALAATDASLDTAALTTMNEHFKALRDQIRTTINNAANQSPQIPLSLFRNQVVYAGGGWSPPGDPFG